jgi:aspartate/methionine/tyrosine aminotransferase
MRDTTGLTDSLAAVTPRTRPIVVNAPHNPSGTIATDEPAELGGRLERIAVERRRPIRVPSDQAYRAIGTPPTTLSWARERRLDRRLGGCRACGGAA